MKKTFDDFISNDKKQFKWGMGKLVASSLSGFLAGIVVTAIFIITIFDLTLK